MGVVTMEKMMALETGAFGEILEERIFFAGPPSTCEPARRARLQARKAAAGLMRSVSGRGPECESHCERVAIWSRRIARDLGLSPERMLDIELGALLHDVGYVGLPDLDLDREGAFTAEEEIDVQRHPYLGAAILGEIPALRRAVPLVLAHHEEFDGAGYPHGLSGLAIPIDARIFHLVDAYESLTHDRPHRPRMNDAQARAQIARGVGRSFDPLVHAAFEQIDPVEWQSLVASVL